MITRRFFHLLFALTLVCAGQGGALQVTTSSNVNLRLGPSTSARVLTVIPKATLLTARVCITWCSVQYGDQQGYVSKSVLTFRETLPVSLPVSSGTYTNVDGLQIESPVMSDTAPAGASAHCRDGSYSFSTHRSGTCSHHGGVAEWL